MTNIEGAGVRRSLVALTGVVALGLAGCSSGKPASFGEGDVAGLPVTHFESGLKPNAPEPDLDVTNAGDDEADRIAIATIADVEDYWSDALPSGFDMPFEPVKSLLSYDSEGPNQENGCGDTEKNANAFYCSVDDSVAWDRGVLLPTMMDKFGPLSVVTVLAHEFGHAVQYRLGDKAGITRNTPTIVKEQQADCFAGGYYRWVAEGKSKYFAVSTSDGLNSALSSLFLVRDSAGTSATDRSAHGTGFDRIYAFQIGFERGPKECAGMTMDNIQPRLTERPFDAGDRDGDITIDREAITALQASLDQAFQRAGVKAPEIVDNGGSCASGPATPPATYCASDNTVSIDLAALSELGQPVDQEGEFSGSSRGGHGDFAAFSEVASRYAIGIQKGVGASLDNANAGLRTACLVGAWAAATTHLQGGDQLRISAGDLDEAISDLLRPDSLVAADVNGTSAASGFNRVEAMRTGYLEGSQPCSTQYG
ncbi:neutral zinc metallopeptidase [Amycolatopsis thermophila]|uniref:Metalloprotease n=1 Tax=Amycolatopsis thermophila TaxID=206084 RepID=A0ABU0EW69_9PSEU|nr:neutral zinc metallopeptidase [Amycolatopsis thermophila]MDQ0379527.1 putative metalloprotease [Amycolatopsis thermophila]